MTGYQKSKCLSQLVAQVTSKIANRQLQRQTGESSHTSASVATQHNLIPAYGQRRSSTGKVTAGLAESNGSLLPDGWLCHLRAACTLGSAPGRTHQNEYGRTSPFYVTCIQRREALSIVRNRAMDDAIEPIQKL